MLAAHGGEECNGPASMDESCNVQNCQGIVKYVKLNIVACFTMFVPESKFTISLIDDRFYLHEKGKKQCPTDSAVLDTDECKEACTTLGIRLSNAFKNGQPCFKGGNGVCKQSSKVGSRATLVCKTIGNIIFIKSGPRLQRIAIQNHKNSEPSTFISDDLCHGITCSVSGEICESGECKCGNEASCENRPTGSYCDAGGSRCKCAQNVDACPDGISCVNGECDIGKTD